MRADTAGLAEALLTSTRTRLDKNNLICRPRARGVILTRMVLGLGPGRSLALPPCCALVSLCYQQTVLSLLGNICKGRTLRRVGWTSCGHKHRNKLLAMVWTQ